MSQPIPIADLQTHELIDSLRSDVCPACADAKYPMQSFCRKCYYAIPRNPRLMLYQRVGHGYEAAMVQAFTLLNKTVARMPGEPWPRGGCEPKKAKESA